MNQMLLLGALDFVMIKVIFALVFGAIWLINWLFSGNPRKVPPVVNRPNGRRVNLNQPGGPGAPHADRAPESLSSEIEQFLKEAAQRKSDKGRRGPVARPAAVVVVQPQMPPQVEVAPPPAGESMTAAVNRHLDTRGFAARASNLTDDMQRADVQREQHLKDTFGHKIGRLTDTSHTQPEIPVANPVDLNGNVAASLVGNLLTKPENLRQAIVLNEILRRPEDRW